MLKPNKPTAATSTETVMIEQDRIRVQKEIEKHVSEAVRCGKRADVATGITGGIGGESDEGAFYYAQIAAHHAGVVLAFQAALDGTVGFDVGFVPSPLIVD